MIEYIFNNFLIRNKVIFYSESVYDVEGYSSVSFKAVKNGLSVPQFKCRKEIDYIIDLTQSLEVIQKNMNRNARRNIKKAEQNDIKVKFNQRYQEFYEMYKEHYIKRKHIKWFNIHKFDEIKKYGTLVIAEYDDKIISGSVFLEDEDNIVYWITASDRFSNNKEIKKLSGNATYLIQMETIKYAKLKGIKEYNLGPCAYDNNINKTLVQFKKGLGSKPYTFYIYQKDYNLVYKIIRECYRKLF